MIQKKSGQPIREYLQSRLFDPLDIRDLAWTTSKVQWLEGCHTQDLAKLGLLYLNQGKWRDKQLLPASWVKEATSSQISTAQASAGDLGEDWKLGYGYQFWSCRNGAYRGDGAFGQYCIVMPEQDAVAVITSNTADMQGILGSCLGSRAASHGHHQPSQPCNCANAEAVASQHAACSCGNSIIAVGAKGLQQDFQA